MIHKLVIYLERIYLSSHYCKPEVFFMDLRIDMIYYCLFNVVYFAILVEARFYIKFGD